VKLDILRTLDRLSHRYPSPLVDVVVAHEPGHTVEAIKNVTVNEEYFQGHFPGMPLMPGVMMVESLLQVASILLFEDVEENSNSRAELREVNNAKFRRQVLPGDCLNLKVTLLSHISGTVVVQGVATVDDSIVAEAELVLGIKTDFVEIDPTAVVHPRAVLLEGTAVGPYAVIGPKVRIGRRCRIGASAVIEGDTQIGDECRIFPFASIGLVPQDLKFSGEHTRLVIGHRNVFRESVTVHRGTRGGGGVTSIGDDNVFMAYAHVAHDCVVGNRTICGNGATLGGHVLVEDGAAISAYSGVHQFCRVGRHAFIGGYSVVTKDALPYGKTVGNRARIYGLNTIGLIRRSFSTETVAKLRRAYRYLLQSKLNTTRAVNRIINDQSLSCPEVDYLVEFIQTSKRGVTLRRPPKRVEPVGEDD